MRSGQNVSVLSIKLDLVETFDQGRRERSRYPDRERKRGRQTHTRERKALKHTQTYAQKRERKQYEVRESERSTER